MGLTFKNSTTGINGLNWKSVFTGGFPKNHIVSGKINFIITFRT